MSDETWALDLDAIRAISSSQGEWMLGAAIGASSGTTPRIVIGRITFTMLDHVALSIGTTHDASTWNRTGNLVLTPNEAAELVNRIVAGMPNHPEFDWARGAE